jgi:hypothetical protein
MNLREIEWVGMDWINLAQDRNQLISLINTLMKFGLHEILGNS